MNALLVLIISYVLKRLDVDGWNYLKYIFLKPGQYFGENSAVYYLANGLTMLTIALLLFFSKGTNRFIDLKRLKIKKAALPAT